MAGKVYERMEYAGISKVDIKLEYVRETGEVSSIAVGRMADVARPQRMAEYTSSGGWGLVRAHWADMGVAMDQKYVGTALLRKGRGLAARSRPPKPSLQVVEWNVNHARWGTSLKLLEIVTDLWFRCLSDSS